VGEGELKEVERLASFLDFKICHRSALQRNRTSEENTLVVGTPQKKYQFPEPPLPPPTPTAVSTHTPPHIASRGCLYLADTSINTIPENL
jgi:hypothetical protein